MTAENQKMERESEFVERTNEQNSPNEKPQKWDCRSEARVLHTENYGTMKEKDMRRGPAIEHGSFRTGGWVRKSARRPSQRMCARQAYRAAPQAAGAGLPPEPFVPTPGALWAEPPPRGVGCLPPLGARIPGLSHGSGRGT